LEIFKEEQKKLPNFESINIFGNAVIYHIWSWVVYNFDDELCPGDDDL